MALAVLLVSEGSDSSLVQANRAYAIEAKRCNPIIPLENVCKTVFFSLKKVAQWCKKSSGKMQGRGT